MTLYYVDDGHAGTWQSGRGIIFTTDNVNSHIRDTKAFNQS